MNTFFNSLKAVLFSVGLLCMTVAGAQDSKKNDKADLVKALLQSKNFVFKAQSASPMGGGLRNLTSEYDVRVFSDTVKTFLPYFGRAYTATIGSTNGGINFTSTDFEYQFEEGKKGRVDVVIRPKDVQDVRQLLLRVSPSGNASLQVISNNRQPISFNGYVAERSKRG